MSLLTQRPQGFRYTFLLAAMALLGLPLQAADQVPGVTEAAWNELMDASSGSRVKVTMRDGSFALGQLVATRADEVVLENIQAGPSGVKTRKPTSGGRGLTFLREDIATIEVLPDVRGGRALASFDRLLARLDPGQKISITDTSGARFGGTVVDFTPESLILRVGDQVRTLQEGDVATVIKKDSLLNGTLIGAGIGLGASLLTCGRCHAQFAAASAAMGAGIGVTVDSLMGGSVVLYQRRAGSGMRISVAPQLATSHSSVAVSIGF